MNRFSLVLGKDVGGRDEGKGDSGEECVGGEDLGGVDVCGDVGVAASSSNDVAEVEGSYGMIPSGCGVGLGVRSKGSRVT